MIKHYSSDSQIALNIVLNNGKSTHITFIPLSSGGSVYSTSVEEIQNALEKHYRFGDLFVLNHSENDTLPHTEKVSSKKRPISEENNLQVVSVNDLGEAKDFLAETFGVSRTSLKSQKSIIEIAKANGIEFDGLDL